jgi:hypothetical protein
MLRDAWLRVAAFGMSVAAEPAWLAGSVVALIGSVVFFAIALGGRPEAILRVVRGLRGRLER